jgi:hypothetical protein
MALTTVTPPVSGVDMNRRVRGAVISAHGGSGATTVAALLRWPEATPVQVEAGAVAPVVVTARSTAPGLAAVLTLMQVVPAEVPALLVVSGDAPLPMPPKARGTLRLLKSRFRLGMIALPYVPAWRYQPPNGATASKRWRRAATRIPEAIRATGG